MLAVVLTAALGVTVTRLALGPAAAAVTVASALAMRFAARAPLLLLLAVDRVLALAGVLGHQLVGHGRGLAETRVVAPVERGDGLAGDLLDVFQQPALVIGAQADGHAAGPGARGAADAEDIGFRHIGQHEVA